MDKSEGQNFINNVKKNEIIEFLENHAQKKSFLPGDDVIILEDEIVEKDYIGFMTGVVLKNEQENSDKIKVNLANSKVIKEYDKEKIYLMEDFIEAKQKTDY